MGSRSIVLFAALLCVAACVEADIKEWSLESLQEWVPPADARANADGSVPLLDPPYHAAGYIHTNNTHEAEMFYFYFQERSRDPDAPLLFWTNGGPGCSSLYGLFTENGPYEIQDDLTLKWREYGWDVGHNLLYVDQPVGTGMSFSKDSRDYVHYEERVGEDMLMFFRQFLELHPELKGKDFYLSGESYGGHYLPAIARSIHQEADSLDLNLKGVLMGNPCTSPLTMSLSYPDYAAAHDLVTKDFAKDVKDGAGRCIDLNVECNMYRQYNTCIDSLIECDKALWNPIRNANPDINVYDIRKECIGWLCYDHHLLKEFLNDPKVQDLLGVDRHWDECSTKVMRRMYGDMEIDQGPTVRDLVDDGLRFIVYVGDQDLICNWMGNSNWLNSMAWGKSMYWTRDLKPWSFESKAGDNVVGGKCEAVEPLTFCTVADAGHMVPTDMPEAAYNLLRRFITGGEFVASGAPTAGSPARNPFSRKTIAATFAATK